MNKYCGFSWPKEYLDIVMRNGYSSPHTREYLNIVMRRIPSYNILIHICFYLFVETK